MKTDKKFSHMFENFSKIIILSLLCFLFIILFVSSLVSITYYPENYREHPLYRSNNYFLLIILTAVVLCIIIVFDRVFKIEKINTETLLRVLMIYVFSLSLLWVFISRSIPHSDQKMISSIASQFCENDFSSMDKEGYIGIYPFQLGMVSLLELIYSFNAKLFIFYVAT